MYFDNNNNNCWLDPLLFCFSTPFKVVSLDNIFNETNNNTTTTMSTTLVESSNDTSWLESIQEFVIGAGTRFVDFVLPKWYYYEENTSIRPTLRDLWEKHSSEPMEFMLRTFDTNGDGHISSAELLNMTEIMKQLPPQVNKEIVSWSVWFQREWPLMDWKIGLFIWQSFSGILILLTILSIVPGRLHGISGKILRWPILALTYFLILVELVVYVIIRLFIRIAEYLIARPKHRKLRYRMGQAKSYPEWYEYASNLDKSQKRDKWLKEMNDQITSKRYNWGFIRELMKDLKKAREYNDSILALAVLQQCTRKNVGGIMSEDLFSYSNTGEPKQIVKNFVEEVVTSLYWLVGEVEKVPIPAQNNNNTLPITEEDETENDDDYGKITEHRQQQQQKDQYDEMLQRTIRDEKNRLWQSLLSATMNIFIGNTSTQNTNSRTVMIDEKMKRRESQNPMSFYHRMEVLAFLKRARAAYGRTALCLSGGAMMGLYHFGHILGLLEAGVLPHIISGTSGGSVVGAIIACRNDDELRRDLNPEVLIEHLTCFDRSWPERLKSLWQNGSLFSFDDWMKKIKWFTCGEMTFAEAYKKTGRVFCVTLSSTTKKAPPVLLNYLTAPDVTVASAVIASAAVPGFIPPVRLQYKDATGAVRSQEGETYFDGSIEQDIPVNGLAEMFNCQFFIACQANPHIVPFFYNSKGGVGRPSRWSSGTQEDSWRGGFLLSALELYLKNDMKAKCRFLHDLEAAVGFTSSMMIQEFVGSTTIVPQVSFIDYFRLFSDPQLSHLYRYFQAGSVAAYEHTAMIKLHYSIVDTMDACIDRLERGTGKRRRISQPRMRIEIPETKGRAKIVIPESNQYAGPALILSPGQKSLNPENTSSLISFSSDSAGFEEEDEDEIERKWVQCTFR